MIKKFLALFLLTGSIWASSFDVNAHINSFSLPDQFDKIHTVNGEIKTIVVSFEKATGKEVNTFLSLKKPDFLQQHQAVFIANISGMPSIITKMFALPKMRDYKHNILLIYDENDTRFLQKEGMSPIYTLENGVVKNVHYVSNAQELEEAFK